MSILSLGLILSGVVAFFITISGVNPEGNIFGEISFSVVSSENSCIKSKKGFPFTTPDRGFLPAPLLFRLNGLRNWLPWQRHLIAHALQTLN